MLICMANWAETRHLSDAKTSTVLPLHYLGQSLPLRYHKDIRLGPILSMSRHYLCRSLPIIARPVHHRRTAGDWWVLGERKILLPRSPLQLWSDEFFRHSSRVDSHV